MQKHVDECTWLNTPPNEGDTIPHHLDVSAPRQSMHQWERHLNAFQNPFVLSLQDPHLLEFDILNFQAAPLIEAWPKPKFCTVFGLDASLALVAVRIHTTRVRDARLASHFHETREIIDNLRGSCTPSSSTCNVLRVEICFNSRTFNSRLRVLCPS